MHDAHQPQFFQTTIVRPHSVFSVLHGRGRHMPDLHRVGDGIVAANRAWWVCPRIAENSGFFLERATPEPPGAQSFGDGYPVSEGWLFLEQITWPSHPGAIAYWSREKFGIAFYASCHSDRTSTWQGKGQDRNGAKTRSFSRKSRSPRLRFPSFRACYGFSKANTGSISRK